MNIDFVILWVDGNDPAWQAEKALYEHTDRTESGRINRYRDWGLLPYWFRAVEKYTPWVNRIHFVTWGHLPPFLNTDDPRLHIVKHRDFIPAQYLPTFNSHAIEMNIHRIPGLSEHFVYFNDDMFLLRPMQQEAFFREGLPCTCGSEKPMEFRGNPAAWIHAAVNDLALVNTHFPKRMAVRQYGSKYRSSVYRKKDNIRTWILEQIYPDYFTGFRNLHAPAAYRKRTFRELWEAEADRLDASCSNRFRGCDQINQWAALWWQIASGQFCPAVIDNQVGVVTEDSVSGLCHTIEGQKHDFICLNDPEDEVNYELLSRKLRDAFEMILPDRSSFEKDSPAAD